MPRATFKRVITEDGVMTRINEKNLKIMERFLKEKDTRCSTLTIENYRSDLNIFFSWNVLHNDNKFFVDIRKLEFSDFFSYCVSELKWGSARFNRMRSCLSSLSQFIEKYFDDDYPNFRNVVLKVVDSAPKSEARIKTVLKKEQVDALLASLRADNRLQEVCFISLAIASGARIAEILRITTDIINPENLAFEGIFIETLKPIKTKGRTKTGKLIHKYIIKDIFVPSYLAWMEDRRAIMSANAQEHNNLFIKKDGTPAEIGTIRSWIPKWEKILGVPVYPHAFRHYTVTYLAGLGLAQELIVELMGWTSSEMFKLYNDLTAKDREWKDLAKLKFDLNSSL